MMAPPRSCAPSGTFLEAIVIIRGEDGGALTVMVEDGPVPGGAATDRDEAQAGAGQPDMAVRPDVPLDVVKEKFGDPKVRRLVVIDPDGRVLGVIARADLAPQLPDEDAGGTSRGRPIGVRHSKGREVDDGDRLGA